MIFIIYKYKKTMFNGFLNGVKMFDILIKKGFKIKNEIPRKQGIELVFYTVDDCILARSFLKDRKTSIRENSLFVYF